MSILHVADLHQGIVTHSRPDSKTGLPSALLSVARCWNHAVDVAIERHVDALIDAGDTFHDRNPDADSIALFAEPLARLKAAGIEVLIIGGNHDRAPHPGRRSVIEAFHDPANGIHVSTRPEFVEVGGLMVATLPSVSRHQLMADDWSRSRTKADEDLVDGLCRILGMFRTQEVDVLVGHWPVQGAILGNEKDIAIVPEPVIPVTELEGPWRYVAMGHIHKAQPILGAPRFDGRLEKPYTGGERPILGYYSGSVDRMNFGEERDRKVAIEFGFDAQDRGVPFIEHELPARRFHTIEVLEDGSSYLGYEDHAEGAITRVLNCRPGDEQEWRRVLAGAELLYIHTRQEKQERRRAADVTEASTPLDALDQFLDIRGVAEANRPGIRTLGKQLIEEVRP